MHIHSPEDRERIYHRLRRIEGQVRGVQRMLEQERDCRELIQQIAAIRSAVQQTGLEVMRTYAGQCLSEPDSGVTDDDLLDYLVGALAKWT
jgi:DNA-binding FrmR family transcriptional regulator